MRLIKSINHCPLPEHENSCGTWFGFFKNVIFPEITSNIVKLRLLIQLIRNWQIWYQLTIFWMLRTLESCIVLPPFTLSSMFFIYLFKYVSIALIIWNEIEPSKEWVEGQVPSTIRPYCMVKPCHSSDVDYEAMK